MFVDKCRRPRLLYIVQRSEMTWQDWYLSITPVAFVVPLWIAKKRFLWLRVGGFMLMPIVMVWYHACMDMDSCSVHPLQQDADHFMAMWFCTSMAVLFANFKRQLVEMLVELLLAGGAAVIILVFKEDNNLDWTYTYCSVSSMFVIFTTWAFAGPPNVRVGWTAIGTLLLLTALTLFLVEEHNNPLVHGSWHLSGAVGAAMLMYGTRDPALNTDYVLLQDILQHH